MHILAKMIEDIEDDDECPHTDLSAHGGGVCTCACGGTVIPIPSITDLYPRFHEAIEAITKHADPKDAFEAIGYTRAEFVQQILTDPEMSRQIRAARASARVAAAQHVGMTKPDLWLARQARESDPEAMSPGWSDKQQIEQHIVTQQLPTADDLADRLAQLSDAQFDAYMQLQEQQKALLALPAHTGDSSDES